MIKDVFAVHTAERRGFRVLVWACVLALIWAMYQQWFHRPSVFPGPYRDTFLAWSRAQDSLESAAAIPLFALFPFDPNTATREDFLALGLSERQADVMLNYRAKGGVYSKPEDLARMRCLSPSEVQRLLPFVRLEPVQEGGRQYRRKTTFVPQHLDAANTYPRTEMHDLEINTCDSAQLVRINGIGPAFAKSIIAYRKRLGGYHHTGQLAEVRVLRDKPEVIARLRERFVVDTSVVRRININTCSPEELTAHPYLYGQWKMAKALVAYRVQHGPFRVVADVRQCVLFTDSLFVRMQPYLKVE
jgi:competence protein ComEA